MNPINSHFDPAFFAGEKSSEAFYNFSMEKQWFVYTLTNYTNSVFYIGVTNNLDRRVWEHKHKINPNSFSSKYRLFKLVWYEAFNNPVEAIEIEKKIKKWRREKKLTLIKTLNPDMKDLMALR